LTKKICVVTGSRADYGLIKNLMNLIKNDSNMKLQIIVTGSHLSPKHGETYKEIEKDGFIIDFKVEIIEKIVDLPSTSRAMGKAHIEISKILFENKPDLMIVLGDRYEILSAATAALILNIPVAHIHGGEETQGAFDNSIRHAITKMSQLHFVATKKSRTRVMQMGESPEKVFNFGGLGVDSISSTDFQSRDKLENLIGQKFGERNLLVTFHPETISEKFPVEQIQILLEALRKKSDINLIFTGTNADPGSHEIGNEIKKFVESRNNAVYISSLGQESYFSTLQYCDGVIGNSSSGILEVPSFKKATINIGDRQLGREFASSVINCEMQRDSIVDAIEEIYSKKFRKKLKKTVNPYGDGGASIKIYTVIKNYNLTNLMKKAFYDL
jgi:GDP/UDP-N,N'-diacetylbacillosamine 2-epimerase (hydrolysing)